MFFAACPQKLNHVFSGINWYSFFWVNKPNFFTGRFSIFYFLNDFFWKWTTESSGKISILVFCQRKIFRKKSSRLFVSERFCHSPIPGEGLSWFNNVHLDICQKYILVFSLAFFFLHTSVISRTKEPCQAYLQILTIVGRFCYTGRGEDQLKNLKLCTQLKKIYWI